MSASSVFEVQRRTEAANRRVAELQKELQNLRKQHWHTTLDGTLSSLRDEIADYGVKQSNAEKLNASLKSEINDLKQSLDTTESQMRWKQACNGIYPLAERDATVVDTYSSAASEFEVAVPDPYRWMEDDSAKTREWINAQVSLTNGFMETCDGRDVVEKRIEEILNYPRYSCPYRVGNRYFYRYNSGLQNQSVMYTHLESMDTPKQVLVDPNTLSEDGTTSLKSTSISEDGQLLAYSLSRSGSDWSEYNIKEIGSGKEYSEVLKWCKFTSLSWMHDNKGFFYNRYEAPAEFADEGDPNFKRGTETSKLTNQKLFYHKLGTDQSKDLYYIDAVTCGDAEWLLSGEVSDDGEWLIFTMHPSCDPVNRLSLVPLKNIDLTLESGLDKSKGFSEAVIKLVDNFDAGYDYLTNEGSVFYFMTNYKAPNYRIVSVDISDPSNPKWSEVVPESKRNRLEEARCVNKNLLLLNYIEDVKNVLRLVDLDGKPVDNNIEFPAAGSICASGRKEFSESFFYFSSFMYPGVIYHYDYNSKTMKKEREIAVPGFNADQFQTEQVFYKSKDGTDIPMYILSPKNMKRNGKNPTILYGYGGFDISLLPSFSPSRLVWLQNFNGIYAVANLRGGGEYGEEWHQAGTKANKQNVFDDFHCAAEFLIANKFTSTNKLAIQGGSNGGLLVSACCNQRPDLYRVGVCQVPVTDMLRFHKFTIGYAWCSDFGCADKAEEFDALYAYSPLNNVPKNCKRYPAFMALTADHDDRVVPLHTFKFMSELQYLVGKKQNAEYPILTRIQVKAGHGAGMSLKQSIVMLRDIYSFVAKVLGAKWVSSAPK